MSYSNLVIYKGAVHFSLRRYYSVYSGGGGVVSTFFSFCWKSTSFRSPAFVKAFEIVNKNVMYVLTTYFIRTQFGYGIHSVFYCQRNLLRMRAPWMKREVPVCIDHCNHTSSCSIIISCITIDEPSSLESCFGHSLAIQAEQTTVLLLTCSAHSPSIHQPRITKYGRYLHFSEIRMIQ